MGIFRNIIDKLIYKEKYDAIDNGMSDSNVGGRKGRNIRNHLFIIYGIINSVSRGESKSVDLNLYDLVQCFDSMWLDEAMNNLYDTIDKSERDDKLAVVYENNKEVDLAIKTPFGLTNRKIVKNIVTQGGVWGPIQCNVQFKWILLGKNAFKMINIFTCIKIW